MSDRITLTGLVATTPRHMVLADATRITSFRFASTFVDERTGEDRTNWYVVTAFGALATHTASSLEKGQRVIVVGALRVRDWQAAEKTGTTVEIEAETIGHDLAWGRAVFTRNVVARHDEAASA